MKTSELTGAALDWAVARAECLDCYADMTGGSRPAWAAFVDFGDETHIRYTPSEHWGFGGPIIEREKIEWQWLPSSEKSHQYGARKPSLGGLNRTFCMDGPTVLVAAMRCFVASRLGDEVEVPEELR